RRSGGKPGDVLLVTGRLGGALRSGRHLRFDPRLEQGRWLTGAVPVHAMMDLSDGLARDLPRLARASGVGFELDAGAVPRHRGCSLAQALGEGEDYELLLAVAARSAGKLEALWRRRFPRLALTRIGRLVADVGEGSDLEGGWDHFAE
ncbi:MAG: thiamine-monophosphate kinase, partial [Verrucomicrobiales bacterium]